MLKYIYNIDINNLPLNSDFDPKRKIKKRMLYNSAASTVTPTATQQSPLFPLRTIATTVNATNNKNINDNINNNYNNNNSYKPRSRTEIYSPNNSSFPASSALQSSTTAALLQSASSTSTLKNEKMTSSSNSGGATSNLINSSLNLSQSDVNAEKNANGQPLLTRQRKLYLIVSLIDMRLKYVVFFQ